MYPTPCGFPLACSMVMPPWLTTVLRVVHCRLLFSPLRARQTHSALKWTDPRRPSAKQFYARKLSQSEETYYETLSNADADGYNFIDGQ